MLQSLCCLALATLTGAAQASEFVAYRLSNWKQMHYDDPGKAAQHLAVVKKLGCEARQERHGGHTDVVYRSPKWQALEVANDELAHQWEAWLKGAGFETLHGHAAAHDGHGDVGHNHAGHDHGTHGAELVAYRLANWTTMQGNSAQLSELVALLQGLGCEMRSDERGERTTVSVRCPQWKHIELSSHAAAHGCEDWLRKRGFEVEHTH
jgi:hypothetical protein